jgi:hypothetical protein
MIFRRTRPRARRLRKWFAPRFAALLCGLAVAAAVSVPVLRCTSPAPRPRGDTLQCEDANPASSVEPDENLGYRWRPNYAGGVSCCHADGRVLYEMNFVTDDFGRRVTPQQPPEPTDFFALFVGCSYAFGATVNDDETLPAQFAQQIAGRPVQVYNYGVTSWGPHNILALMGDPRLASGVRERRGILIYLFIDHHVDRAIGRFSWLYVSATRSPYYQFAADGSLVRKGLMDRRHIPDAGANLLYFLWRSWPRLWIDWPPTIRPKDLALTAAVIAQTAAAFANAFDSQGFYVLFYPGSQYQSAMTRLLEGKNIRFLPYARFAPFAQYSDDRLAVDLHPTPLAYHLLSERMAGDLAKAGVLP